jgi:cytochrome P450
VGFIEAYTALYSGDKRKELFTEWIFRRRQELFVELREHAPFFVTPEAVFVSHHEDVKAIFEDSIHFNVKAYLGSYDFVLGKDKEDGHDADRAFLEGLLPQAELERVHKIAAEEIERILGFMMTRHEGGALPGQREPRKPAGRIDVPHGFARRVSTAVAQHYFGLTDPKPVDFGIPPLPPPSRPNPVQLPDPRPFLDPAFPCVGNWIATLNGAFIHGAFGRHFAFDPATIQQLLARVPQVRKEVATHMTSQIEELQKHPPTDPTTILQRMVAAEPFDPAGNKAEQMQKLVEKVIRNLVGMVNGMVDNVTAAVSNTMDFFLSHPTAQEMATEVAQKVTSARDAVTTQASRRQLWGLIREALRFNAPVPFLLRIAREDLVLAPGTTRETHIAKGKLLFLSVCSAMMDERKWEQPFEFRPDRNFADADDLIFGTGWHDCFGKYIAQVQIVEMIRSLLMLSQVRRAPGPLGKLEYGTFFPKQLAVDFGPQPVQNALTAVMEIKQPQALHARALKLILSQAYQQVVDVLDQVGTVHFARFVFLEHDTKLALITTYDGAFDNYIENYIEVAGDLFDLMLEHIKDAPPLPVRQFRDEFIAYVERADLVSDSQFYSAYGDLTVQDILGQQRREKK